MKISLVRPRIVRKYGKGATTLLCYKKQLGLAGVDQELGGYEPWLKALIRASHYLKPFLTLGLVWARSMKGCRAWARKIRERERGVERHLFCW